jgi:DNA-3-methyladenine glycosylase
LIRAVEPLGGIERMRVRRVEARWAPRSAPPDARLAAGPALVCQALGVTRELDGHDLTSGVRLWIEAREPNAPAPTLLVGPRIGVDYAGEWAARPWRFGKAASPSLTRPFPLL